MDWFVDTSDPDTIPALRRELAAYLQRHGKPGSDFDAAEFAFSELITNAFRHAASPAWVTVDWSRRA